MQKCFKTCEKETAVKQAVLPKTSNTPTNVSLVLQQKCREEFDKQNSKEKSIKWLNSVVIMENESVKVCLDLAPGTNAT